MILLGNSEFGGGPNTTICRRDLHFTIAIKPCVPRERLAATTALNHNWIVNRSQNKNAIEHQKLKRFLAQRKWRVSLSGMSCFIRSISENITSVLPCLSIFPKNETSFRT